jgi:hypothetical protein
MPTPRRDGRFPRPTVRRRLSDRMIRGLVPDLARADRVYDELQRGLAVFIQPSGQKSFVAIYRHRNRNRWHKIGDASIGIAAARKIAARVLHQVAEGRDPQAERVADRAAGGFAELPRLYVDGHARRFNKSWRQAAKLIENHVLPGLGRAKAASITRSDVKTIMRASLIGRSSPTRSSRRSARCSAGRSPRKSAASPRTRALASGATRRAPASAS